MDAFRISRKQPLFIDPTKVEGSTAPDPKGQLCGPSGHQPKLLGAWEDRKWRPAQQVPMPMFRALGPALSRLGLPRVNPESLASLLRLDEGLPDSAVGALKQEVMADPQLAQELKSTLSAMSDRALASGCKSLQTKLLRLELLAMAVPEKSRSPLLSAIRKDMDRAATRIQKHLEKAPDTKVGTLVIGGGPAGTTIAHTMAERGHAGGTLVVDAGYGENNFGQIRNFWLNSENGDYDGVPTHGEGRSTSPIYGSPIQVGDLTDSPYPDAGSLGDAALIGLYAGMLRGVNVLSTTRVLGVEDTGRGNPMGRYKVQLLRNGQLTTVRADRVAIASGMGRPRMPEGAEAIVHADRAMVEADPNLLNKARVLTGRDLLTATYRADDPMSFWRDAPGPTYLIGAGDGSNIVAEHFAQLSPQTEKDPGPEPGQPADVKLPEGCQPLHWVGGSPQKLKRGQEFLTRRYQWLEALFSSGAAISSTVGRLQKVEPHPEKPELTRLYFKTKDGRTETRDAGRVVLALGVQSHHEGILAPILPDYDPQTNLSPIEGRDPAFGDGPIGTRLSAPNTDEQDVFFAGISSQLPNGDGTTFLQWFGWKASLLADQLLAVGEPMKNPFHQPAPAQPLYAARSF